MMWFSGERFKAGETSDITPGVPRHTSTLWDYRYGALLNGAAVDSAPVSQGGFDSPARNTFIARLGHLASSSSFFFFFFFFFTFFFLITFSFSFYYFFFFFFTVRFDNHKVPCVNHPNGENLAAVLFISPPHGDLL